MIGPALLSEFLLFVVGHLELELTLVSVGEQGIRPAPQPAHWPAPSPTTPPGGSHWPASQSLGSHPHCGAQLPSSLHWGTIRRQPGAGEAGREQAAMKNTRTLSQYTGHLSGYRDSYCKDKMVVRPSYLYNGIPILVRWHLYIEPAPRITQGYYFFDQLPPPQRLGSTYFFIYHIYIRLYGM